MARRCYVQVLSEQESGALIWLALTSAMSARECDPDAKIMLVLDRPTREAWTPAIRETVDATFSSVVEVETPHAPGARASRHLKTSLRSLLDGDFLFVDIDTLMIEPPIKMFDGHHDIGACFDRNWEKWSPHRPTWVNEHYENLGWTLSDRGYFNTGVLFMRDNAKARAFGAAWHLRWQLFVARVGKHQDQPAFNSLVAQPDLKIRAYPLRYNAMVDAVPFFCWRAVIVHYFLQGGRRLNPADSVLWQLARTWRETGRFDRERLKTARDKRDPWVHPTQSLQIELAAGEFRNAAGILWKRMLSR